MIINIISHLLALGIIGLFYVLFIGFFVVLPAFVIISTIRKCNRDCEEYKPNGDEDS